MDNGLTESQKKVLYYASEPDKHFSAVDDNEIEAEVEAEQILEDVISNHFKKTLDQLRNKNAGIIAHHARIMISEIIGLLKEKDNVGSYVNTLMAQLHQGSFTDVSGTQKRLSSRVPSSIQKKMINSINKKGK